MFRTKFGENRSKTLNFRYIQVTILFLSWHKLFKIRRYSRSFLTEEAKLEKHIDFLKDRALWNRRGINMEIQIHMFFLSNEFIDFSEKVWTVSEFLYDFGKKN